MKYLTVFLVLFITGCQTSKPTISLSDAARELAQAVQAFDDERARLNSDKDLVIDELSATLNLQVVNSAGISGGGSTGTFKIGDRAYGFSFSKAETVANVLVLKFKSADKSQVLHNIENKNPEN